MFPAHFEYILHAAMICNMLTMATVIFGGFCGWHAAAFIVAFITTICFISVSPTHAMGHATAYTATLLMWAILLHRIGTYLTLRPPSSVRRIHLLRRPPPQPQKMAETPYYQLQRPVHCHHRTCWAAAAAFPTREKKALDGLSPFMREQWALAAPGTPRPDMEEVLATLNVTPAHHFARLVCWAKESWESLPRTALLVVSAVLCVLVVRPTQAGRKFLSHVDWTKLYVVVGGLVCFWLSGGEKVERAPAPRYEKVVSYYLVPEMKAWSRQ